MSQFKITLRATVVITIDADDQGAAIRQAEQIRREASDLEQDFSLVVDGEIVPAVVFINDGEPIGEDDIL